jgi:hypothetical protein
MLFEFINPFYLTNGGQNYNNVDNINFSVSDLCLQEEFRRFEVSNIRDISAEITKQVFDQLEIINNPYYLKNQIEEERNIYNFLIQE